MTDDRHAFWSAYLRHLADHLRLSHYDITLSRQYPDGDENAAWIWVDSSAHKATIRLASEWEAFDPTIQRWFCLHELIHCHFERIDVVLDLMNQRVEGELAKFARDLIKNEIEFAVDDLARALAPFLPLPEEWYAATQAPSGGTHVHPLPHTEAPRRTDRPYEG